MNYPTTEDIEVRRVRRPAVETTLSLSKKWGVFNSGVEVSITRSGVLVTGYYDSFVGIQSFLIPWEMFDRERADVMGKPK